VEGDLQALAEQVIEDTTQGLAPARAAQGPHLDASAETACGIALAQGARPFMDFAAPESADLNGAYRLHREAGLVSGQMTPLLARSGTPIGLLATYWRAPRRCTERELQFLDLLARHAADLIELWQTRRALQEAEARLRRALNTDASASSASPWTGASPTPTPHACP
jgi:GAF domain-containing protein